MENALETSEKTGFYKQVFKKVLLIGSVVIAL